MKKITLFLFASLFSALSFAALNPYAYGLSSTLSADETKVTISYSLNADATSVDIVILDGEIVLKTVACDGKTTKDSHSVDILTDGFPKGKTLTWKVEVTGAGVTDVECTNDATESKYMFFRPQGVAIDNNPESDFFGRIYIALPRGGYDHTKGVVVFDPVHNVLSNSGITATGVALASDDTYGMHRIAVNPTNGKVYYAKSESPTAIYELTPDNTNILSDGGAAKNVISSMSVITNANSLCFDKSGAMYVLGNAGYASATDTYTGKIYKIENGTISEFTKEYYRWASKDNSIVSDERGGFWVAQQRTNFDGCDVLAHVNSNGTRDYKITSTVNNTLLPTKKSGSSTNASYRGQVAHYLIDDNNGILAFGGGGKVSIFKVTYAANEVPTLTAWKTISLKSTSWKANVDGLAFDYAGNLIVMSATDETFEHYALPKDNNTCITPCPSKHAFSLAAPAQLTPFAYGLESTLSPDETTLTIKYSLNALATSVNWVLLDGNNVVKTVDLASLGLEKGDYTTTISTTDFPQYKRLTWKIEVKGVAVNKPTEYPISHDFYHPSSVDIDNNPENPTFGLILCNEAMQSVKGQKQTDTGEDYLSSSLGAGIYAFNPAFENTGKYNGGNEFTTTRADGTGTAYSPRRIRISDDGRIFVTSLNTDGNYLWEVNPMNLNEWTPVFKGTLNSNKELVDARSNFVAAPNIGFDVRGEGANLKLLMLSSNLRGFPSTYAASAFKCHEYNLGTATTWSATPSKTILSGKYMINYTGDQVAYDAEGGVWFCQHQGTAKDDYPSLVHIDKNGVEDYKEVVNNRMAGGIRFNADFSKVIIAGIEDGTKNSKKATLYKVSKDASGKPILTPELVIDMTTLGNNLNDFAWDYAGNLYGVSNSSEKIAVWAMPHSSEDVVATPVASKYAFSIGKYTMTVNTNDENKGTVSGGGEYLEGDVVTLTATAKEGYELLYWSDRSTENPRNITMTKNEALSAYFVKEYVVEPTFTIEKVWENTNVPGSAAGYQAVGWDGKIYMQNKTEGKIKVYNNGTDAAVDYAASNTSGQQIAVDEVGNLIVFNATFYSINPNAIQIYKNGSTTAKAISFTLPHPERCDFISASGDIYSAEGGYVYFYCQNKNAVNRVKITNGELASVDAIGNTANPATSVSHVMVDIFGNLAAHCRSTAVYAINSYTGETTAFNDSLSGIKLSTLGGCSFELGGKEFWAYNVGTTHYNSEWNLYNMTDKQFLSGETLYAKDKVSKKNTGPANWLNVQVVDENTAYIYQFCPEVAVAVWKVTMHEVVLRDTVNNEDLLIALNGSTTNVSVYRSLTGGMYNTLCLPFDVNELTGTPLENATVWQYNGATVKGDGTNKEIFLEFEEVDSITAGKPYLVEPAEDIKTPMEFKDVTISVTNGNNVAQGAVTMHGILHPTELQAEDKSILFLVDNNNLAWANVTANMNGMRAYFKVNEPSLLTARTRAYIRREPTVATDMENITTTDTEIKKVIYNNMLYIIRGNEVYTVQGTKVK